MYFQTYGSHRPGPGAYINLEHPFSQGLLCAILFDSIGTIDGNGWQFRILNGTNVVSSSHPPPSGFTTSTSSGNVSLASTNEGIAFHTDGVKRWQIGSDGAWEPTTYCTVCCIRRSPNAGSNAGNIWGDNTSGTGYCMTFCPYSDGKVYWYFGGNTSPNLLTTAASVGTSTIKAERYIMHAGPRGSAIWRDGIILATQSTAITRTTGSAFYVSLGGGDTVDYNYFAIYNTQWSDTMCQWWSAEPYAHLYNNTTKSYLFLGGVISSIDSTVSFSAPAPSIALNTDIATISSQVNPPGVIGTIRRHKRFKK